MSIVNVVPVTKMKKAEQEDMLNFLGQDYYEDQHRSSEGLSLDSELLQILVGMNEFPTNELSLDVEERSPNITDRIKDIRLEQEPSPKIKEKNLRRTLKGIHLFSSDIYSRVKKGIRLHIKKEKVDVSDQKDDYGDTSDDISSPSLTVGYHSQPPSEPQLRYPQTQSAAVSYSTPLSGSTVIHNNFQPRPYAFPTVESSQCANQASAINVLALVNLQ